MISLSSVRDLLLPGLWGSSKDFPEGYDIDIFVDYPGDRLELRDSNGKRETLFTRDEIEDGSFKGKFAPRIKQFREGK